MKVYERVGENDKEDGQSTTIISITERKTGFQILLQISLVLVSMYCVYKVYKAFKLECRWTWSEVAILGAIKHAGQKERGL